MAAKAFGLQVAELDLRKIRAKANNTEPKPKQSKYLHVHWHARRCRWYAQVASRFLGSFTTERHAMSAVVKAGHASSAKELRLHKPRRAWRPRLPTKSSPARGLKMMGSAFLSAQRFRDLWFLYRQASGSKGHGVLPGDLANALQHAKSNAFPIMTAAKEFASVFVLMKYLQISVLGDLDNVFSIACRFSVMLDDDLVVGFITILIEKCFSHV